jgi:hypothetical protein
LEEQLREAQGRIEQLTASLAERAAFEKVLNMRRRIGYGTGFVGVASLIALGIFSFASLHSIVDDAISKLQPSFFWALILGHALITVALVFLCYQIIRASERLMLPYWWVERHPDTAKAMLGVMDPVSTVTKVAEQLADAAGKVAGAATAMKAEKP